MHAINTVITMLHTVESSLRDQLEFERLRAHGKQPLFKQ